jgi:hypothetical protein
MIPAIRKRSKTEIIKATIAVPKGNQNNPKFVSPRGSPAEYDQPHTSTHVSQEIIAEIKKTVGTNIFSSLSNFINSPFNDKRKKRPNGQKINPNSL